MVPENTQTQAEQIEQHIKDLKALVERKDLALKLEQNPEFRELVLKGFCESECARFARVSTDPTVSQEARVDSLAMAQSAGYLMRWFSGVVRLGSQAIAEIAQAEEQLAELRAEGGD